MPFDALVMAAVRREIDEVLPARVDRVHSVARWGQAPSEVALVVFRPGIRTQVLVSMHPRFARVHLSSSEKPVAAPTPFVQVLRKHLEGAHLLAAEQVDRDRVLILHFRTTLGTSPRLAVEIMGPGSNLILVDGEGRIVEVWRKEGPRPGRPRRILLPGVRYEPPAPPATGAWGPFSAREVAARAAEGQVADALWAQAQSHPRPVVIVDAEGRARDYWCLIPVAHGPVGPEYPSMSQLLDDFHEEVQTAEESAARRGRLGRILAREHQRQARLVESLRHDLERARENLRLRAWGELLLAQATHVPAGQDRIEVTDYYQEEPRPLTIPLDPALTVRRNAQEYLRRYTKARRSLEPLKRRLDSENARLAYLEQLEEALARAADGDTLEILEQEMLSGRILVGAQGDRVVVRADGRAGRDRAPAQAPGREGISRGAARTAAVGGGRPAAGGEREGVVRAGDGHRVQGRIGPRKSRPASTHRVLRFSLPEGEEVVVGTGAEANDFVTFVLGRPDDVWMHARGVPGSHVLLRPPPGRAASPDALVRAASVAAYFSRLRTAAKAQVDWTFRKHVRRRPGGGPGQVFYREEHTLLVEPAPPPDRDERRPPHEAPP